MITTVDAFSGNDLHQFLLFLCIPDRYFGGDLIENGQYAGRMVECSHAIGNK
jgi:hypothetical protein